MRRDSANNIAHGVSSWISSVMTSKIMVNRYGLSQSLGVILIIHHSFHLLCFSYCCNYKCCAISIHVFDDTYIFLWHSSLPQTVPDKVSGHCNICLLKSTKTICKSLWCSRILSWSILRKNMDWVVDFPFWKPYTVTQNVVYDKYSGVLWHLGLLIFILENKSVLPSISHIT